ncbi:hypothetical protein APS_1007 [Acetobacter pasteurianus subsp. pasteurianus LMG 1262 = NBRC 106471]|nr:hypothetical protein APS_1007 [Acetobacter pasteurianus subsp. pasteurianus LMG 1262 = NBRC 106471]CCT59801.1 hypothetical protein APA386B_1730 [Acetobacter pasteurianus 386B]
MRKKPHLSQCVWATASLAARTGLEKPALRLLRQIKPAMAVP